MSQRKMKKVRIIALVTVLLLSVAIFATGCGSQTDFERAEEMLNDAMSNVESLIEDMIAFLETDPSFEEIEEKLASVEAEMDAYIERYEDEFEALELTAEEEDRLDEMLEDRMDEIFERFEDVIEEMLEAMFS